MQAKCTDLLTAYIEEQANFGRLLKEYESKRSDAQLASQVLQEFHSGSTVEWNGTEFECGLNRTTLACTTMASGAHEKCACQRDFGSRQHLYATCQREGGIMSPALSLQRCNSRGLLDNNLARLDKARKMIQEAESLKKPVLRFPSNTCGPCHDEFKMLEQNFTYPQIDKVKKCISRIKPSVGRVSSNGPVPSLPTEPIPKPQMPEPEPELATDDQDIPKVAGLAWIPDETRDDNDESSSSSKKLWWQVPLAIVMVAVVSIALYKLIFKGPLKEVTNSGQSLLKCSFTS